MAVTTSTSFPDADLNRGRSEEGERGDLLEPAGTEECASVNGSRKLTPLRQMKTDPPAPGRCHGQCSSGALLEGESPAL